MCAKQTTRTQGQWRLGEDGTFVDIFTSRRSFLCCLTGTRTKENLRKLREFYPKINLGRKSTENIHSGILVAHKKFCPVSFQLFFTPALRAARERSELLVHWRRINTFCQKKVSACDHPFQFMITSAFSDCVESEASCRRTTGGNPGGTSIGRRTLCIPGSCHIWCLRTMHRVRCRRNSVPAYDAWEKTMHSKCFVIAHSKVEKEVQTMTNSSRY